MKMIKLKELFNKANKGNKHMAIINLFDKNKFINLNDNSRVEVKVTQVVLFAFFMSLLFNFMLVVVILILLPLKEKIPYFVHFLPKDEQIVYVEEFKQNKKSQRVIKEYLARDYVKKRETIDLITENDRWNYVMFISNNQVKSDFYKLYQESLESPYKWAVNNNIIRHVSIISSSVLSDNQIQVEFEILDSARANGQIINIMVAIANVSFEETDLPSKGEDYLKNPFNYLVSDYFFGIKEQKKFGYTKNIDKPNNKTKENQNESNSNSNEKTIAEKQDW